MVDQSRVTSGFDVEVQLSERYLRYAFLAQIEAGRLPLELDVQDAATNLDAHVTIHPPTDYQRLYDPDPAAVLPDGRDGSFDTRLLFGDPDGANLQLSVTVDITDNVSGQGRADVTIGLMLAIDLASDPTDRGFERNHRLSIALVKLDPATQLGLAFAGLPVDVVTAQIKAQLDRTVPFGVANGQTLQRAELAVLPGGIDRPPAMAAFLDLALKDDPDKDAFVAARGDVSQATNFLDDGKDLAFGTSPGLWALLGRDAYVRMAEEDPPDSGSFRHPLRKVPTDPQSEEIGTLDSIEIGPEVGFGGQLTGRLLIQVNGEYELDNLPNPDFHLLIRLRPVIDNGLLTWEPDVAVDVDILGSVLGILGIIVTGLVFGIGAGVALFMILLAADLIVDAVATALVADREDEIADASFLDTLPHRLAVAGRRWDPLYDTRHQVVALMERFDITQAGMAFDGVAVLGREPAPRADAVIRTEERDAQEAIVALDYRVSDLARIAADLAATAPGTDRRPYALVDPTVDPRGEANLVSLSLAQVATRIETGRLLAPIAYEPERIHLVANQIDDLLVLSSREIGERRDALISAFRVQAEAQIRADEEDQITADETQRLETELGRPPTQDEIDEAVDDRVKKLVDEAQEDYEEGQFPADLRTAIAAILRFDLAPEEFAALQNDGVLAIVGKEIYHRRGTIYYRDHPDWFFADNLLALPRYSPPYTPLSLRSSTGAAGRNR